MDLPIYPPSDNMLQALKFNFNNRSLNECNKDFSEYSQTQKVSYENVGSILKTLLSIEDISTMHLYSQLMEQNVFVTDTGERIKKGVFNGIKYVNKTYIVYEIKLSRVDVNAEDILTADLDELVLVPKASLNISPLPKHIILAQMPHMHEIGEDEDALRRHFASIKYVKRSSVTFAYPEDIKLEKKYPLLIFRSQRIPMRIMYDALVRLSPTVRRYIFPITQSEQLKPEIAKLPTLTLINADIATNAEQLQAVQQIVAGPSKQSPYIIFGPPGTGKTTTVVEAILQLYLQGGNRILVTAGSNSACDTIALKISECIEENAGLKRRKQFVLRLYSQTRLKKGTKNVHPLVKKISNFISLVDENEKLLYDLSEYGIVVTTLCLAGFISFKDSNKREVRFTHVFIDEAAASTEPEALLGIVGFKDNFDSCVILSGDHKQLGPVVMSQRATNLGLGQSLMERLMLNEVYKVDASGNYDCTLQTRLRRNYRSHPEIVKIFNKLYYDGELIPLAPQQNVNRAENWSQLPNGKFPILFQVTHGETLRWPNSRSSYNELEAKVVCWVVNDLLENGLDDTGQKVIETDIGIIAPYLSQCNFLGRMLKQRRKDDVEVGTVESFQGREKQIIIVSFVASFINPSFAANPRRLNVLLSRAISLMILVGNPTSLAKREDLRYIIDQCKLHGHLVGKDKNKKNNEQNKNKKQENKTIANMVELEKQLENLALEGVPTTVIESITNIVTANVSASVMKIFAESIRGSNPEN